MSCESNIPAIPPGIAALFKKPPLLVTESRQDYEAFFNAIVQAISPRNGLEWIATGNYVNQQWDIRRQRQAKAGIVNATRREAFRVVFESILPDPADRVTAANMADQWFVNPDERPVLLELLEMHDLDDDAISAQALAMRAPELEMIDREIHRLEVISMAQLREIEFHRRPSSSWRGSEQLLQIVDGVAESVPLQPSGGDEQIGAIQQSSVEGGGG
jgi:hypothetical protein